MYDFKANIAVLLNITPDHLDRYDYKMENYVNAKFRIIRNQTEDDAFIYWNDDPVINEKLSTLTLQVANANPFAETHEPGTQAYTDHGELTFDTPRGETHDEGRRTVAARPPQPLQLDGCRPVGLPAECEEGDHTQGIERLRVGRASARTGCFGAGCAVHQRLEGYECQLVLVCTGKYEDPPVVLILGGQGQG